MRGVRAAAIGHSIAPNVAIAQSPTKKVCYASFFLRRVLAAVFADFTKSESGRALSCACLFANIDFSLRELRLRLSIRCRLPLILR